jgi:hypothetical protein
MKSYISVISIAALILVALGFSSTGVAGHIIHSFPGLSGSGIGLLVAGVKTFVFHA